MLRYILAFALLAAASAGAGAVGFWAGSQHGRHEERRYIQSKEGALPPRELWEDLAEASDPAEQTEAPSPSSPASISSRPSEKETDEVEAPPEPGAEGQPRPGGQDQTLEWGTERSTAAEGEGYQLPGSGAWCFSAEEAIRVTWPFELLPSSETIDTPHIRLREGSLRYAMGQGGAADFVFDVPRTMQVRVYVRARYLDECGNSLIASIDGGPISIVGDEECYGQSVWSRGWRRFALRRGRHRLTLRAWEDGLVFDRVVILPEVFWEEGELKDGMLEALPITPPPVFESMPPASATLPRLGSLSASICAPGSVVVGKGHRNDLLVRLHLNGSAAQQGRVVVSSWQGRVCESESFRLTPESRHRSLLFSLDIKTGDLQRVPVDVAIVRNGRRYRIGGMTFLKPVEWAFLGPVADPEGKGLDLLIPGGVQVEALPSLPPIPGYPWRIVEDGSCYNPFGVVDFNKLFGRPNRPRHEGKKKAPREVAWAVCMVRGHFDPHRRYLYAADDKMRFWVGGEQALRVDTNLPMDSSHLEMGTSLQDGRNPFVFQVSQTESYWQLLFTSDNLHTRGVVTPLRSLPLEQWETMDLPAIEDRIVRGCAPPGALPLPAEDGSPKGPDPGADNHTVPAMPEP
jgi:hypothetical protein